MNMKRKKPLPQPKVKVDLSQADTVKCEKCGNYSFIQSYFIKKMSAIMSPNGQEAVVPVQVFSCGNCGIVPKVFSEGAGVKEEIREDSLFRPDLMG